MTNELSEVRDAILGLFVMALLGGLLGKFAPGWAQAAATSVAGVVIAICAATLVIGKRAQ